MKTIYLTGFMGAGKTTLGRILANQLQIPVKDSDEEIVRIAGKTIRTIFENEGEAYFRDLETKVLQSLPTHNIIVTTGGGVVLKAENREWMKTNGILVYLHCDFEVLWKRLKNDQSRPLLLNQEKNQIEELYFMRQSYYQDHHIKVDTSFRTLEDIGLDIAEKIKKEDN
jgi:shikimate kinase